MPYAFVAIPRADVPRADGPLFQHLLDTYASETGKTVSVWRCFSDADFDFCPHEKSSSVLQILKHQLLSGRRRVLHTCHHRAQLTVYLRLLGRPVPSVYGPTADQTWEGADPTTSVEAAGRK